MSYSANDPSWSHASNVASDVSNLAGHFGAWLSDILYTFFGMASWWLVVIACYEGWRTWFVKTEPHAIFRILGYIVTILTSCALLGVLSIEFLGSGVIGNIVAQGLSNLLSNVGAFIFSTIILLATVIFCFDFTWQTWFSKVPFLQKWIKTEINNPEKPKINMSRGKQLSLPLIDELEEANANIIQSVQTKTPKPNIPLSPNPLDDFLDETGFSKTKEFEGLDNNEGSNPFKPISSVYLANSKLTRKLNAKLHSETIAEKPTQPTTQEKLSENTDKQTPISEKNNTPMAEMVQEGQDIFDTLVLATNQLPNTPTATPLPKINIQLPKTLQSTTFTQTTTLDSSLDNTANLAEPTYDDDDESYQEPPETVQSVAEILGLRKIAVPSDNTQTMATLLSSKNHSMPMTHQRKVESAYFEENSPNHLDIHHDTAFTHQSRAMQTAQYRANLPPLPPLDLLDLPDPNQQPSYTLEQLQQLSELLEIKLQDFNIKAQVVNAQLGPVVTRFEVELAPGIKASKVTGIAKDLARSLSMASVRVVEVIPGKPYIGIEVPNPKRQMVRLIELLQSEAYQDPKAHLSMAMGKDIAGRTVITDLAKAPHMLVAGTTGSGKSVLVNSLLLSLLLKYTPDNLRLILIDPKQLELANYNDIPHLLTPVVTDMTEATSALAWCVAEMERRYQLMALFKVRKLDEFNKKIIASEQQGHPLLDPLWRIHDTASQDKPPKLKPLPQIVIVADEFADMIMQVGKQAEELITRLAQKSRAAGIHLILATQRPSVDVITGLIKANIPVRSALRVNSKVDSRTILDAGGAEDMLGHGDMLFLGPGQIEPNRVHGAFISDAEVNRICDAWRERGAPDYIDNIFDNFQLTSPNSDDSMNGTSGSEDPLYDEVVAFIIETRKPSTSSIQRKFSIGYNRAGRIMDAMEEAGLVGPVGKNGKRELFI